MNRLDPETFVPPKGVRAAAERGLRWNKEGFGGDGLKEATVREARSIAAGNKQSVDKVKRMRAWFARHSADEGSANQKQSDPTPHEVAWELWGGDAGKSWSEKVMGMVERQEERAKMRKRLDPNL